MGATDTIREFARIATTAGLTKDVIDLMEKKATLLAEQVATLERDNAALSQENTALLRENRNFNLENDNLKIQLQNMGQKGSEFAKETLQILKYFFDKGANCSDPEIARKFQMALSVAAYHTDILLRKIFIRQTTVGVSFGGVESPPKFSITMEGRKHVVENGLAAGA
jgi:regulator of replication initiation timing